MMVYYRKDVSLIKHAIIVISDDPIHDAKGVKRFEALAVDLIEKSLVNKLEAVHCFSDGCAAQYNGKTALLHISEYPITLQHNYFETSHDKSVCDGLGAIVKKLLLSGCPLWKGNCFTESCL